MQLQYIYICDDYTGYSLIHLTLTRHSFLASSGRASFSATNITNQSIEILEYNQTADAWVKVTKYQKVVEELFAKIPCDPNVSSIFNLSVYMCTHTHTCTDLYTCTHKHVCLQFDPLV